MLSRNRTILAVAIFRENGGSALRSLVLIDQKREATEMCAAGHFVTSHDDRDVRLISDLLLGKSEDDRASGARGDLSIRKVGGCSVCVRWRVGLVA